MRRWWWVCLLVVAAAGCRAPLRAATVAAQGETIDLPDPHLQGEVSLEETLTGRRSVRSFDDTVLTWEQIGQLLWAAQGITSDWGGRTAPSAGALYPLELHVVTVEGIYHYFPQGHRVVHTPALGVRQELWAAGIKQDAIRQAPAVFAIAAVHERTSGKYGDRAPRYVHLEAGHAAQNLLLQAVALGLGAVPVGAFYDEKVQRALSLPDDHQPLYLIPVGHPRE
jgi:SagB-type dehydrogenase family enzyme